MSPKTMPPCLMHCFSFDRKSDEEQGKHNNLFTAEQAHLPFPLVLYDILGEIIVELRG